MINNIAIFSIVLLVLVTCFLVIAGSISRNYKIQSNSLSFLLARGTLRSNSIVSLLLSSSFGINALLYAAWLGFSVGAWGLIIQLAWGLSFFLLSPYSTRIRSANSLHDLLGKKFGHVTKVIAAFCTLVGFIYLMGWELEIGTSSIRSLISLDNELTLEKAQSVTDFIIMGIVLGTIFYTLWGGMKGNALVDQLLNFIKILVIVFLTILLMNRFIKINNINLLVSIFPSLDTMKQNLGIFGLMTNIIFNLAWQFIDNSSWQSIIAGSDPTQMQSSKNLRISGFVIFLTIGLIGTFFGISLANTEDITPDNILAQAVGLLPQYKEFVTIAMIVMIAACVMSLLDGLFLSSTYTLTMDIIPLLNKSGIINYSNQLNTNLWVIRLFLLFIAIAATWGIKFIFKITGANLFDFVYIVIITQLALFGPVIIALVTNRLSVKFMWVSIVIALLFGFGSIAVGTIFQYKFIIDGAGTFTLFSSIIFSLLIYNKKESCNE